jgi:hypothetical protein
LSAHTRKISAAAYVARHATLRRSLLAHIAGVLGALLVTVGCTAMTPERPMHPTTVASAADASIQCHKQHITGSLIATKVCTTKAQRDGIQDSTQEAKDFLTHQVIAACPGTPGC